MSEEIICQRCGHKEEEHYEMWEEDAPGSGWREECAVEGCQCSWMQYVGTNSPK